MTRVETDFQDEMSQEIGCGTATGSEIGSESGSESGSVIEGEEKMMLITADEIEGQIAGTGCTKNLPPKYVLNSSFGRVWLNTLTMTVTKETARIRRTEKSR